MPSLFKLINTWYTEVFLEESHCKQNFRITRTFFDSSIDLTLSYGSNIFRPFKIATRQEKNYNTIIKILQSSVKMYHIRQIALMSKLDYGRISWRKNAIISIL